MDQPIEIVLVRPRLTAVVRKKSTQRELGHIIPSLLDEVYEFLKSSSLIKYGHNLCSYLDKEMNIEVGVEVFNEFTWSGNVVCSYIPGGKAAFALYHGPYEKLVQTHANVQAWCIANNKTMSGPSWEIYVTGVMIPQNSKLKSIIY